MRFFDARLRQAFPGYRNLTWIEDSALATKQLEIMLRSPLQTSKPESYPGSRRFYKPVWWTRGYSDLTIERAVCDEGKLIIDGAEYLIDRIAVNVGRHRFLNFVYVETRADAPAEPIEDLDQYVKNCVESFGYASEEFGYRPSDKAVISRQEYDDNGYIRDGVYYRADDFELRSRHLSKFNFIITHSTSYLHASETTDLVDEFISEALKNRVGTSDLHAFIGKIESTRPRQREG